MAIDLGGLLRSLEGVFAPAQVAEHVGQVVQGASQVGPEDVGAGLGEVTPDVDSLLRGLEGVFAPAQVYEAYGEVTAQTRPFCVRLVMGRDRFECRELNLREDHRGLP